MPANQLTGQYNANRLLRELWTNRGLSRIQLAQKLDLDKSTVTHMVSRMEKTGYSGNNLPKGTPHPGEAESRLPWEFGESTPIFWVWRFSLGLWL